jgi:hypothetical protein
MTRDLRCRWSAGGCLSSVVVARHGLGSTSAAPVCVGVVLGVSRGVVGWLWVENCIVDASILFSVVYSCLWLSCQGRTVDALAPGADEGRGRPR